MEGNLLLNALEKYRLEIKYILLATVLLTGMGFLAAANVFDGIEGQVNSAMDTLANYGLPGMFLIGLFSNMSLIIMIPYNLPMFTLVIYAANLVEVIALGIATGIGGGIGEVASYALAHTIVANVNDLEKSSLFRWTKRTIEQRPGVIPGFVFVASATPLPDFTIIVPLAMTNYPWRKMIVPMITGKITMNVIVALLFRLATNQASELLSSDISFDLTSIFLTLFILIIAYQIEKARAQRNGSAIPRNSTNEDSIAADTAN